MDFESGPPAVVLLGGIMLVSLLLGRKVKRDKGLFAYLVVMAVLFVVAMVTATKLANSSRPGSIFRAFGRDPASLGLALWAPYLLGGFLTWLFGSGRSAAAPRPGLVRALAPGRPAAEPSLGRQTFRRVIVTVAATVISYAILSLLGIANTPSLLSAIAFALLAIVFG